MKHFKICTAAAILSAIFTLSCRSTPVSFSRIEYSIPAHINVKPEDLQLHFKDIKTDPSSTLFIVIVLYSYSSGAETISFSGGNEMKSASIKGKVKGLVKVMDGGKIVIAEFVEGGGNSKDEMLSSLVKDIQSKFLN